MPNFDFIVKGTIYDAPDVTQARDMLRKRLLRGREPFGGDVLIDDVESAEIEEVQL